MKVATKWSEITLHQYIEVVEVSSVDMDEIDKQVKIIAILSKESEDKILDLTLTQIKELAKVTQFIYTPPLSGAIKQLIKINGKKYSVNHYMNKLSGGEFIDLSNYTKDKETVTNNLPFIISIFLHPVNMFGQKKRKYYDKNGKGEWCQKLESRNDTAKEIRDSMLMSDVFALSGFFLKLWDALIKTTADYSIEKVNKLNKRIAKELDSLSIGDGI